ncbi:MAG: nitroreductase family protein [Euryarchaeota archaeon]|nr:nitroreductase family protein [Euryarchaeota archaeon]
MDVLEAISERRSIRKFKKKPVEDELLNRIIESGIWAPSAGNIQSWEVIVVKDSETKSKLAFAAYMRDFIAEAPVVMVSCANEHRSSAIYGARGMDLYCIQDAACAAQNMLLAIHALGLGACWIGAFDEETVRNILEIHEGVRPVALIPLGYPNEKPYPPIRRGVEDVIHYKKF